MGQELKGYFKIISQICILSGQNLLLYKCIEIKKCDRKLEVDVMYVIVRMLRNITMSDFWYIQLILSCKCRREFLHINKVFLKDMSISQSQTTKVVSIQKRRLKFIEIDEFDTIL